MGAEKYLPKGPINIVGAGNYKFRIKSKTIFYILYLYKFLNLLFPAPPMFVGPSGRYYYAPKICQIPEIDIIPDVISSIFNGLKV